MRGTGGPSTGAGMVSGAPAPIAEGNEQAAKELLRSVKQQLEQAPGGIGAVYGRDEYGETE